MPVRPPRWVGRQVAKISLVALASLILLAGLVLGGVALVLTPARLTPLVNEYASRVLNARIGFDTVSLSLVRHFPNVGVRLKGGQIVSRAFEGLPDSLRAEIPAAADTLLRFDEFTLALDLPQLLASRLVVRRIDLRRPRVYAYVAPSGRANWEIYAADTVSSENDTVSASDFYLHVARLTVHDTAHIVYDSRPDRTKAELDLNMLSLKGTSGQTYRIDWESRGSVRVDTLDFCRDLPVSLHGGFAFDTRRRGGILFDGLTLEAGGIPVRLDGRVDLSADSIDSRLNCRIRPLSVARLIGLIPEGLSPSLKGIETDIALDMNVNVRGSYRMSDGRLPDFSVELKTDGGYLGYRNAKTRLDRLALDASLFYRSARPDSIGFVLRRLFMQGAGMTLDADATVWNALGDPSVAARVAGAVDLDTLSVLFPSQRGIGVRGRLGIDAGARFRLSQLNMAHIGQVRLGGRVTLDDIGIDMPEDTVSLMVRGGVLTFGSEEGRNDSTSFDGLQTLRMVVTADTMHVDWKNQLRLIASKVGAGVRSDAASLGGDTTVVHPLAGGVGARYFEVSLSDSSSLRLHSVQSTFRIEPSAGNTAVPLLGLSYDARMMNVRNGVERYDLFGSHVDMSATLAARRFDSARRRLLLDSLQGVYPAVARDSLFAHWRAQRRRGTMARQDDFAGSDIDMRIDRSLGEMLRRWDANGSVKAAGGRVVTPYFPLPNRLRRVDMRFTTNEIELKNTQIRSGVSSLELTGRIGNLRRALSGRGVLEVDMEIESDTLNFNELARAAMAGAAYGEKSEQYRQSLAEAESSERLQQLIEEGSGMADADSAGSPLIVIPSNIDLHVGLCVRYGRYSTLVLHSLSGDLIARDRCVQLKDLQAKTNAGDMSLTALYATRSRDDIVTGFDLELRRVQVERLISLMPSVDSLLPMLRSFGGIVDCTIAATAAVDTMMNIELPTLNAACSIRGENLVLLDGETFTEISKMLRFKNRERNLIDRISVDLLVHDNRIELFPFIVEMDRYKAAVSGVQRLDMSFDYHISVLKSPIPFRLGVNIFGTLDKFKFRIGRARYKSENLPSFVGLIDTTRVNLRRTITDIFRRGVDAASLGEMRIAPTVDSSAYLPPDERLSRADSLMLQQEGILPDSVVIDSSARVPASEPDSLAGRSREPADEAMSRAERRRERKALKRERRTGQKTLPSITG